MDDRPVFDRDDEGFADCDSPEDDTMETNLAAEGEDELLHGPNATVYYRIPISPTEKEEQGVNISKEEIEEMKKSEPYQKKLSTCHLCKQCWYDNSYSKHCPECDGFALQRPCVICDGRCEQIWQRNINKTHSFHKAHWEGRCDLPLDIQQVLMQQSQNKRKDLKISTERQCLSTS
ncbi:hypothetical protein ACF0H5_023182 [Mactra antiquata]